MKRVRSYPKRGLLSSALLLALAAPVVSAQVSTQDPDSEESSQAATAGEADAKSLAQNLFVGGHPVQPRFVDERNDRV